MSLQETLSFVYDSMHKGSESFTNVCKTFPVKVVEKMLAPEEICFSLSSKFSSAKYNLTMLNKCSKCVFLSSYEAFSEGPIVPGLGLGAGEGTTFILKAENISLSTFVNTYTYIQVSSSIY